MPYLVPGMYNIHRPLRELHLPNRITAGSLSYVSLELFPLDIASLGVFLFSDTLLLRKFNDVQTEMSLEAGSLTAPRPGRMQVDAVDGFKWRVGRMVRSANKSRGCSGKERSAASGQALRRRRSRQIYWVETAVACCCYYGGESAPPTNEQV